MPPSRGLPEATRSAGGASLGYLALFVGSGNHGLSKDGSGLFFGYLEYKGAKYTFRKLSDILNIK